MLLSSNIGKQMSRSGLNMSSQSNSASRHAFGNISPSSEAEGSTNSGTDDSAESSPASESSAMTAKGFGESRGAGGMSFNLGCDATPDGSFSEFRQILREQGRDMIIPYPLDEETLEQALAELPAGARLAARTCIDCWKSDKFPTKELISFLRSIAEHSSVLSTAFGLNKSALPRSGNISTGPGAKSWNVQGGGGMPHHHQQHMSQHPPPPPPDAKAPQSHGMRQQQGMLQLQLQQGSMEVDGPAGDENHGEKRKRGSKGNGGGGGGGSSGGQACAGPLSPSAHKEPLLPGAPRRDSAAMPTLPSPRGNGAGRTGSGGESKDQVTMGTHSQAYDQTKITAELRERNSGFNAVRCRTLGITGDRLKKIIPKLFQMLPSFKEQGVLLRHVRDYVNLKTSPEQFAEEMKRMVDEHQIVVRNDEADIPKGPRCIWLPPTTPDGRARRATTTLIQSGAIHKPGPVPAQPVGHPQGGHHHHHVVSPLPSPKASATAAAASQIAAARKRPKTFLEQGLSAAAAATGGGASVWNGASRPAAGPGGGGAAAASVFAAPYAAAAAGAQTCGLCSAEPLSDNRWVQCDGCGRYYHSVCARYVLPANCAGGGTPPFFCPRAECTQLGLTHCPGTGAASAFDLLDTPLGGFLTSRARAAARSGQPVTVKVLADVLRSPSPPLNNSFPLRSKAVFAFQRLAGGSEVTLFGMYVHEYGPECLPPNAGRAYVQCIDSTPLYGSEQGDERQEVLTAIVSGYMEYAREAGFRHVHLHVPPPTDECAFIFTSRSVVVRIRACMHLAHWYRRVLESAVQSGSIYSFQASPAIAQLNFPPSLLETAEAAAEAAFRTCTAAGGGAGTGPTPMQLLGSQQSADLMQHIASLTERFFVVNLLPSGVYSPAAAADMSPMMPSAYAGTRHDFVMLCQKEDLHFHSLPHGQYSTAVLAARILQEQRQFHPPPSPAHASSRTYRSAAASTAGGGQQSHGMPPSGAAAAPAPQQHMSRDDSAAGGQGLSSRGVAAAVGGKAAAAAWMTGTNAAAAGRNFGSAHRAAAAQIFRGSGGTGMSAQYYDPTFDLRARAALAGAGGRGGAGGRDTDRMNLGGGGNGGGVGRGGGDDDEDEEEGGDDDEYRLGRGQLLDEDALDPNGPGGADFTPSFPYECMDPPTSSVAPPRYGAPPRGGGPGSAGASGDEEDDLDDGDADDGYCGGPGPAHRAAVAAAAGMGNGRGVGEEGGSRGGGGYGGTVGMAGAAGGRGGKETNDWFSVLVHGNEATPEEHEAYVYETMSNSKPASPCTNWGHYPPQTPYEA